MVADDANVTGLAYALPSSLREVETVGFWRTIFESIPDDLTLVDIFKFSYVEATLSLSRDPLTCKSQGILCKLRSWPNNTRNSSDQSFYCSGSNDRSFDFIRLCTNCSAEGRSRNINSWSTFCRADYFPISRSKQ